MSTAVPPPSEFPRPWRTPPAPEALRPLLLCADDFAISEGVSEGILRLADAGRLTAVGCMTGSPLWSALAPGLASVAARCDVGLHLTLTDQTPLGRLPRLAPDGRLPGRDRLLALALAGRLADDGIAGEIDAEIGRQWQAFVDARGRPPDFVDGHLHVHLLPVVRDALCARLAGCTADARPYLRICWEPPAAVVRRRVAVGKALLLAALSRPLRREAGRRGLAGNDSFRGIHGFDPRVPFGPLMRRFLAGAGDRPLVMCHPGFVDARLRAIDPVTEQRRVEYDYLASERFADDLAAAGVRLARFRQMSPAGSPLPSALR